jgi:lipoyl(octanoyl) transferase
VTGDWKNPDLAAVDSRTGGEVFTSQREKTTGHCSVVDLGFIGYAEAYELQKRLVAVVKASSSTSHQTPVTNHFLLLCEHPHVITLGRSGKREHLLASDGVLRQKGVDFHAIDRGGDITYHGPGQIVGYPILNLAAIRRDVGWYVRMLEETMIRATGDFGIAAHREAGKTGIWVAIDGKRKESPQSTQRAQSGEKERQEKPAAEKLGAIGVHLSRWVTSHGFAYNVSTDLRYFDLIVPCGIADRKATSLEKLLARRVDRAEASSRLVKHFGEVFDLEMKPAGREELFERLQEFERPVAVPA